MLLESHRNSLVFKKLWEYYENRITGISGIWNLWVCLKIIWITALLLLLKLFNYSISSSFVIHASSSSSYSQVINQNTKGFNIQKRALLFGLTPTSRAPCFEKNAAWEEPLLFGQTTTPTEQKHSLTHLWKLLHFYNCSICTALLLNFIIYPNISGFYLLFKRDGWCISPTVTKSGFPPIANFQPI